jgi:hypothetical protein
MASILISDLYGEVVTEDEISQGRYYSISIVYTLSAFKTPVNAKLICNIFYNFFQDLWMFWMIWKILLWILQMHQK